MSLAARGQRALGPQLQFEVCGRQSALELQGELFRFVAVLVRQINKEGRSHASERTGFSSELRVTLSDGPLLLLSPRGLVSRQPGIWGEQAQAFRYHGRSVYSRAALSRVLTVHDPSAAKPLCLAFDAERGGALCRASENSDVEVWRGDSLSLGAHARVGTDAFYRVLTVALSTRFLEPGAEVRWLGDRCGDDDTQDRLWSSTVHSASPTDLATTCSDLVWNLRLGTRVRAAGGGPERKPASALARPPPEAARTLPDAKFSPVDVGGANTAKVTPNRAEHAAGPRSDDGPPLSRATMLAAAVEATFQQRIADARRLLDALATMPASSTERALELTQRALLAYRTERDQEAVTYLSEATRLLQEPFRDLTCAARIAHFRGLLYARKQAVEEAESCLERARGLYDSAIFARTRTAPDAPEQRLETRRLELELAQVDNSLGNVALALGDVARARDCADGSIARKERLGDAYGIGFSEDLRGRVHTWLGNFEAAELCFERALDIARQSGDPRGRASVLVDWFALESRKFAAQTMTNEAAERSPQRVTWRSLVDLRPEHAAEAASLRAVVGWLSGQGDEFEQAREDLRRCLPSVPARYTALALGFDCVCAENAVLARERGAAQRRALDELDLRLDALEWSVFRARSHHARGDHAEAVSELRLAAQLRRRVGATYLDTSIERLNTSLRGEDSHD